ncbi:MAG: hypothetical protein A2341_08805 [Deltaproteobacteria bacterium RIFOXYB12_FULL_58_9]|nr:MAG: hypothetical protein A2341_08805 [Deltaproteobacteria bacterium RIFOXYB12_FULL_58_9]
MNDYTKWYGELEVQRLMVSDRWRTDAFARAIQEVVTAGDVVVDLGTGTGILAMFAARAGASKVYAIDEADIATMAVELIQMNGLEESIEVFHGSAAKFQIQEKADLIISEWLGHMAFVEGMVDDLLGVRDRVLKPGGRMLPSAVEVMLAPIDDPVLYSNHGPGFWRRLIHDVDLSILEELELKQGRGFQTFIDAASLLSVPSPIVAMDMRRAAPGDQWTTGKIDFEVKRDGVLNGFVGWFVAELSENVILDTGPNHPQTHWSQMYLPFPPQIAEKGSHLSVDYQLARHPEYWRSLEVTIELGDCIQRYIVD